MLSFVHSLLFAKPPKPETRLDQMIANTENNRDSEINTINLRSAALIKELDALLYDLNSSLSCKYKTRFDNTKLDYSITAKIDVLVERITEFTHGHLEQGNCEEILKNFMQSKDGIYAKFPNFPKDNSSCNLNRNTVDQLHHFLSTFKENFVALLDNAEKAIRSSASDKIEKLIKEFEPVEKKSSIAMCL